MTFNSILPAILADVETCDFSSPNDGMKFLMSVWFDIEAETTKLLLDLEDWNSIKVAQI